MNDAETEIARLKARIAQLELENSRLTQRIQYLEKSVNAGSHGIGSSRPSSSGGGPSSTTSSRTSDVGSKLGTITFDQNNSDTSGGEQKYCDTWYVLLLCALLHYYFPLFTLPLLFRVVIALFHWRHFLCILCTVLAIQPNACIVERK